MIENAETQVFPWTGIEIIRNTETTEFLELYDKIAKGIMKISMYEWLDYFSKLKSIKHGNVRKDMPVEMKHSV